MKKKMKLEKIILLLSTVAGGIISMTELVMAWYSDSQAILMDGIFDTAEVVVSSLFLIMLPFIYQKETEKMPYGYAQLESIFIFIKGSMLTMITLNLMFENVKMIIGGGSQVDSVLIGNFELAICLTSIIILWVIIRWNKGINSQVVKAEIISWKLDVYCCFGVSMAFLSQVLLAKTSIGWIGRYVDQVIAIIIACIMLPQPIKMVWQALKSIILIAPEEATVDAIKTIVEGELEETPYVASGYDIVQTGRKIWVDIYIKNKENILYLPQIKELKGNISRELQKDIQDISVDIMPDLN